MPDQQKDHVRFRAKSSDVMLTACLREAAMAKADVPSVVIQAPAREPFNQARADLQQYQTRQSRRREALRRRREAAIDVFMAAQRPQKQSEAIRLMEAKIIAIGPAKVSYHAADLSKMNVPMLAPLQLHRQKKPGKPPSGEEVHRQLLPALDPAYRSR